MKKINFYVILSSLLFITACNNERDVISDKENSSQFSKFQNNDPLCIGPQPTTPSVNFGNPNDYPKIFDWTYYSLTRSQEYWFFDAIIKRSIEYINTKYHGGADGFNRFYVADQVLGEPGTLVFDSTSSLNIYRSEYEAQELYPENNVSPMASSYALYKILSSIDEHVSLNPNLKPIGIYLNFDVTMCGNYSSLRCLVYYKKKLRG